MAGINSNCSCWPQQERSSTVHDNGVPEPHQLVSCSKHPRQLLLVYQARLSRWKIKQFESLEALPVGPDALTRATVVRSWADKACEHVLQQQYDVSSDEAPLASLSLRFIVNLAIHIRCLGKRGAWSAAALEDSWVAEAVDVRCWGSNDGTKTTIG